jgi:TP901 family phage tail tape measure protein
MARIGGSRVFFDVIGQLQAARLITDTRDMTTMMRGLMLDAFEGINASLTEIFSGISQGIQSVLDPALELGESEIFFEKFFAFDDADRYAESIKDVGLAFGFTGAEALDAGARMAQLGGLFGSPEAVTAGTQAGIAFGLIGGMETEDAMKRLISLAQQTGFLYEGIGKEAFFAADAETQRQYVMMNSLKVMDELNSVENASVATMEQLSTVMDQFSASATIANMSIAEQAALSATLVEAGESASKAGRSLRMMLARIGSDTGGAATALHEFGVATQDVNGDMVGLTRIMDQLVEKGYHDLTSAEQAQLAQAIAGRDHYTRFIKLMENYDRVTQLTATATERQSTAVQELTHFTDNATFAHNQLAAAMESTRAEIGQELLPAITAAESASYGLTAGYLNLIQRNEELKGGAAAVDSIASFFFKGASNAAIMANGIYDLVGGVFSAYMNVQSLIISIRVYQSIQRQSASMEQVMAQIAQKRAGVQKEILEVERRTFELKGFGRNVDVTALNLQDTKRRLLESQTVELNKHRILEEIKQEQIRAGLPYSQQFVRDAKDRVRLANLEEIFRGQSLEQMRQEQAQHQMLLEQDLARLDMIKLKVHLGQLDLSDQKLQQEISLLNVSIQERTKEIALLEQATATRMGYSNTLDQSTQKMAHHIAAQSKETTELMKNYTMLLKVRVATGLMSQADAEAAVRSMQVAMGIATKTQAEQANVVAATASANANKILGISMNQLSSAAALASMALMFFPENENAMQASMILMAVSMVGPILQMQALSASADRATVSLISMETVATGGLALGLIVVGLVAARLAFKNHREELDKTTASTIDYMTSVSAGIDDLAYGAPEAADLMLDFGDATAESMEKAEASMRDFASAREELFFGFSPTRMSQTLFDQLVNQGVGELYYRNEVSVNNNFYGLTLDEVVDKVSNQIEARITARMG